MKSPAAATAESSVITIRDFDAKWGGFRVDGGFFTRLIYVGV
jgi:hypothetical protein